MNGAKKFDAPRGAYILLPPLSIHLIQRSSAPIADPGAPPTPPPGAVECDCPFCPLQAERVNICDLRVTLLPHNKYSIKNAQGYEEFREQFLLITLFARNNYKLKRGLSLEGVADKVTYTVECLTKNQFKLCIHTAE